MIEILKYLFYSDAGGLLNNIALLGFRLLVALELFRVHGLPKFSGEHGVAEVVPNPLHLPTKFNQFVATFSDTVVPFLIMLGFATRLAVLPVIGVTAIGYFVVHRKDSLPVRDVPYMYTVCFTFLAVTGPGTISLDHLLYTIIH
ncbi:MAG TPA: DoxX family protein [Mucilaginibacter sp.]|jgi:putative oxidoreductase